MLAGSTVLVLHHGRQLLADFSYSVLRRTITSQPIRG